MHWDSPVILSDFSVEALQVRREWHDRLRVLKEKNFQTRIIYPERLSFRIKGKIVSRHAKAKVHTTKMVLQEV